MPSGLSWPMKGETKMLASLTSILAIAEARKNAVGAFNTPNLESLLATLRAAEKLDRPVILMHAQVHERYAPLHEIGPVMVALARRANVPVCVHLDHGEDMEYVTRALDIGFNSVMFDGSTADFAANIEATRAAANLAHERGASIEAELGALGKREMGAGHEGEYEDGGEQVYTDPDDAEVFVRETGVDALACSFGTAHGLYLKEPQLDFGVLSRVRARVNVPLVMHGGSGVSEADFRKVIDLGIRKINYYTYMAKSGGEAVREMIRAAGDRIVYFHDVAQIAERAIQRDVEGAIRMFSMDR